MDDEDDFAPIDPEPKPKKGRVQLSSRAAERAQQSTYFCDGNQLELLREQPEGSFDLIYIQWPNHNVAWWTEAEQKRYLDEILVGWPRLRFPLCDPDYEMHRPVLVLMAACLIECKRLAKHTGSVVTHGVPEVEHLCRVLMDKVYGVSNFRDAIGWHRGMRSANLVTTSFVNHRDFVDRYSVSGDAVFTPVRRPANLDHASSFTGMDSEGPYAGRRYKRQSLTGSTWGTAFPWYSPKATLIGRPHDKEYRHDHRPWAVPSRLAPPELRGNTRLVLDHLDKMDIIIHNVDKDVPDYKQFADETIESGYPLGDLWEYRPGTQGTLYMSDDAIDEDVKEMGGCIGRFIEATTGGNARVLLPFCDEASLIAEVCRRELSWVAMGYDSDGLKELRKVLPSAQFKMTWTPTTFSEAKRLRTADTGKRADCERISDYYFAKATGAIRIKRDYDEGADREYNLKCGDQTFRIVVSIKSGGVSNDMVRSLIGVMQLENPDIGVLLTWDKPSKPTKGMKSAMDDFNEKVGRPYGIQWLSLEGLMTGREKLLLPGGQIAAISAA